MTLGERIWLLRRRRKLTQREVATAAELNLNTYARLERDEIKDLSGQRIVLLAKALQVSTDVLLGVVGIDDGSELLAAELAVVGA